jgi:hypothetical protein
MSLKSLRERNGKPESREWRARWSFSKQHLHGVNNASAMFRTPKKAFGLRLDFVVVAVIPEI